ncbi:MAG: 16S rRNA (guanine(966)-N(2))-methyltransferase RsmD [Geothermobacteraceae bacterium]
MRIISGTARGHRLATFSTQTIRPTPDRVREAVFNMLVSRIGPLDGLRVLDLFAGSGAMGIEALSRGADYAVFVDPAREAGRLIERNLRHCRLEGRARLIQRAAASALTELGSEHFDLVFLDPPYHSRLAGELIEALTSRDLLSPGAWLVVETDSKEEPTPRPSGIDLDVERRFGRIRIELLRKGETL